ncbi:oxidative stress-responsive serine-rich protein 1 [Aplochiton taeniatus]
MEAGGKDNEEDTLQTAFKKLRVDAESLSVSVNVSEALTPKAIPRACPEAGGAKSKLGCPKENWHGSLRKTSRGPSRSQRRRRSKSPILHPPKFTYCSRSSTASLSPSSGRLKHQRLAVGPDVVVEACCGGTPSSLAVPAQKDHLSSHLVSSHDPSPVFGASTGYEPPGAVRSQETVVTTKAGRPEESSRQQLTEENGGPEKIACAGATLGDVAERAASGASDFQALSKLHSRSGGAVGGACCCSFASQGDEAQGSAQGEEQAAGCLCRSPCPSSSPGWQGVEVYAFTGLRNVISECERNLVSPEAAASATGHIRTQSLNDTTSTSPPTSLRTCSEQARAFVDDITIEDLSGYMEYYLYIPKKMSHMAEMMYT